jgi:valyl-tRNA synthetase
MFGDTAVAVNPDDERYKDLIGKQIRLPLSERLIPVIADSYVDPAFGSGAVKITPAHDFNDYEIGARHNLEQINILTPQAKLNDNVPQAYRGLDRFEARKRVIADLESAGLIEKIEEHPLVVPRGERTNAILEPYLTDQWYVRIAPLAGPAIAAVEAGKTRFIPESWGKTYFEWMKNIKDWCVSRQIWWGHRIPAWYDPQGNAYVGRSEAEIRSKHKLAAGVKLKQDDDVLDTWFSSALWPFATLGWPEQTPELARFYPTNTLITGFDIIFFWVARMMMMGLKFMGDVPFRDVYITGLIRDEHGDKMSKSKGNVIDPLDVIDGIGLEELVAKRTSGMLQPKLAASIEASTRKQYPEGIPPHGTDALRFTLAALASPSRDIRFDLGRVGGYRNFCNKLWNAARFVALSVGEAVQTDTGPHELSMADQWIRSRFGKLIGDVETALRDYRFDFAASALYEFTWHSFCDWYLELTKPTLQSESASAEIKRGTRRTLVEILEALQRALHPLMPFITEEIWQGVAGLAGRSGPTVMLASYPTVEEYPRNEAAEREIGWVQSVVLAVRQIRGEMNIKPSQSIPVLLRNASEQDKDYAQRHLPYVERLAGIQSVTVLTEGTVPPESAMALVGDLSILVPMEGLIDAAAEAERLGKQLAKAQSDRTKTQQKLSNENFVRNAPPEVVEMERGRLAELERNVTSLTAQLERIRRLFKP